MAIVRRYEVEAFTSEETTWYGQYGIKLKSHDDSRRMWLFRAETEEDQQQWMEVRCSPSATHNHCLVTHFVLMFSGFCERLQEVQT